MKQTHKEEETDEHFFCVEKKATTTEEECEQQRRQLVFARRRDESGGQKCADKRKFCHAKSAGNRLRALEDRVGDIQRRVRAETFGEFVV